MGLIPKEFYVRKLSIIVFRKSTSIMRWFINSVIYRYWGLADYILLNTNGRICFSTDLNFPGRNEYTMDSFKL